MDPLTVWNTQIGTFQGLLSVSALNTIFSVASRNAMAERWQAFGIFLRICHIGTEGACNQEQPLLFAFRTLRMSDPWPKS